MTKKRTKELNQLIKDANSQAQLFDEQRINKDEAKAKAKARSLKKHRQALLDTIPEALHPYASEAKRIKPSDRFTADTILCLDLPGSHCRIRVISGSGAPFSTPSYEIKTNDYWEEGDDPDTGPVYILEMFNQWHRTSPASNRTLPTDEQLLSAIAYAMSDEAKAEKERAKVELSQAAERYIKQQTKSARHKETPQISYVPTPQERQTAALESIAASQSMQADSLRAIMENIKKIKEVYVINH